MIKHFLFFLLITGAAACSAVKNQGLATKPAQAQDSLTYEINQILKKGNFNGFGVAIVNESGILYEKGFGYADVSTRKIYTENTIQSIASVSKTLVGVALMKAVETGKLRLDDPINLYLPFKVTNPSFPDQQITIRQLANHTSTILDNEFYLTKNYFLKPGQDLTGLKMVFDETQVFIPADSAVQLATFLKDVLSTSGKWYRKDAFLNRKPGAVYEYSNVGTTLAAYIIARATGMPFDVYTEKHILQPLKMHASGWKFKDVAFSDYAKLYENPNTAVPYYETITYPDGGFITSTHDFSQYLIELIKGYNGRGTLLSKASYAELFRPQLAADNFIDRNTRNPYSESYNVGVLMGFGYTGYVGHTGGDPGVLSIMFFDPKTNIGRLMMVNTNFSNKAGNDAFYAIWIALEKYQPKLANPQMRNH